MTDWTTLCDELTATWHREIPIVAAMGVTVDRYDGRSLTVRAPFEPNRNVHGTTFAGSLYSVCVLTGWGAVWLALRERALVGVIYAAESTVQYRKGVDGDFLCRCAPENEALELSIDKLKSSGRATFEIICAVDHGDKRAVTFSGKYVVHAKQG